MYPASAFVPPNPPATTLGRMLVHLAAIVLLFGSLVIFAAMRPDPAFLEQRGAPVPTCSVSFGGRQPPCDLVVPDRRIPQRIAIGFGTIAVARSPPRSGDPLHPEPAAGVRMTTYDSTTALLVVDVQNDFADPAGSLHVTGEHVPAAVNDEIAAAREAGAFVVYSQDWHPLATPHFTTQGGVWPVHCVGGTWGAEFHPGLDVAGEAVFLRKGTGGEDGYSVFTVRDPETGEEAATALERILREHGIKGLVIGGLATDYCVKDTVLDARRLGFPVMVLGHAIAAVNLKEDDGARAEQRMRDAGAEFD